MRERKRWLRVGRGQEERECKRRKRGLCEGWGTEKWVWGGTRVTEKGEIRKRRERREGKEEIEGRKRK